MIELLVAMAVTSIIMLALLSLIGQTTSNYTETQRAVHTLSQARAFIQFFSREVSTRLPATPLVYEKGSAVGGGDPGADKIAFIRTISADEEDASHPGDLNTSHYYVAYSKDGTSGESPKLFRGVLKPAETQALLASADNPALPAADPARDEPIVHNVVGFEATPKYYVGDPAKPENWTTSSPAPPSLIELTIRFIDDSSAQRFRTRAEWGRLATAPRDSERQLIRSFTRTISIAK